MVWRRRSLHLTLYSEYAAQSYWFVYYMLFSCQSFSPYNYSNFSISTINKKYVLWNVVYLPHSQDYNDRTVPIIVAGCIAHARNGHVSILPLLNMTSPSCSLTPISFTTRKFRRFAYIKGR